MSTHTSRLLFYFDHLGRMLGYRILSEKWLNTLISPCAKSLQKMKVDLVWDWEKGKADLYDLAVESQQSSNFDLIRKDIVKLANVPAKLKVLYCASGNHERILSMIMKARTKYEDTPRRFLAIIDPWVGRYGFSEGILRGILLNNKGLIKAKGTAKVQEVADGEKSIRMFLNAKWQYIGT